MMPRWKLTALMLIGGMAVLGLQACTSINAAPQAAPTKTRKLVITGSSTVAPLMAEIAKRYEKTYDGARVDVQAGGSSRGIADVRQGVADIGMVSRSLKPQEQELGVFTIALDGIAVIVHRDNPISQVSNQQIVDIYTDKLNNWRQVGGTNAPITVINKAEGHSTLELFTTHFELDPLRIRADVVIGDNEQGIKTIAGNPNAIGYVSVGSATYHTQQGTPLKTLPLQGISPTLSNVRDQIFPLVRPLNLVVQGQTTDNQEQFIKFAQSPQVHDIVEAQYFVPPGE